MDTISYSLKPSCPEAHLFEIVCTITKPVMAEQIVSLPAWIPGSYMIRDFAKNIVSIKAESEGKIIKLHKTDKDTWVCEPCDGALVITYSVYAWDLSVRTAHLDTTHGFFNGTSVFLKVHGAEHMSCIVDIQPPSGEQYNAWRVATALPVKDAQRYQFGTYQAENYDELIDHPVEMGTFDLTSFQACGVTHDIVITGRHRGDLDRLCVDLKKICEQHIRFFGEPAPTNYYVFLVMVVGEGYGGLEHRASCSLLCSRDSLPQKHQQAISEQYREFLGLCSHEYFHTWNIKRIKPAAFTPYNLKEENYTQLLWAFEGITSYYDDLALVRCGLISQESYLELLGQTITRLLQGVGRNVQTVTESSFDAWTKFYKQDENAPNAIVSYYTKGALVALLLDMKIRQETQHKKSLNDVMQCLWQEYGLQKKGVPENGIEEIVYKMIGDNSKHLIQTFFQHVLHTTDELDLQAALNQVGIKLQFRTAESQQDRGGKPASANTKAKAVLGVRKKINNSFAQITHVYQNSAAQDSGLAAGDLIIAINGLKVTADKLDKHIAQFMPGEGVTISAFRRDELMQFQVLLKAADANIAYLTIDELANLSVVQDRERWLANN